MLQYSVCQYVKSGVYAAVFAEALC